MRLLKRFFLFAALIAAGFAGWMAWSAFTAIPLQLNPDGVVDFDVHPGMGLKGAAQAMVEAGVGLRPWQFALLGRLAGRDRSIKAGSYEIGPGITAWQLLKKLTAGDVSLREIVIVEGKTFREMRALIDAHPDLRHETTGWSDREILQHIGATVSHPEGRFFPDTYLFARHTSDLDIYRRAFRAMERRLATAWEKRDPLVPYRSPDEALTMASIIEKETGLPEDRAKIASVLVNRLRLGMPLQADPTVIYGLGEKFDGNLKKRDLQNDTPWNTYTRTGLPPTPICLPGMAAIEAALHPPQTDLLYFVARGDGSSEFSRRLEEHNRAVAKYQMSRK